MVVIIIIALLIIIIFLIEKSNSLFLQKAFDDGNVMVSGKKGRGKDVIFNIMIDRRKKGYKANIKYRPDDEPRPISYYTVAPNTYKQFIEGKTVVIPKRIESNHDYYISDGGIQLPSQYDALLDKLYPSLPIFYALSRQLGRINIHINTQALGRVWIKLREQADSYVMARGTIHIFGISIVFARYYEFFKSADAQLKPFRPRILNKFSQGERDAFEAQNGTIRNLFLITRTKKLTYDTYHYHNVLYGYRFDAKNHKMSIEQVSSPLLENTVGLPAQSE